MDNKISKDIKAELIRILGIQYRKSSKMRKTQILDQFIAVSGYHRKHAIRLLSDENGSNGNQNNSFYYNFLISCFLEKKRRFLLHRIKYMARQKSIDDINSLKI